MNNMAIQPVAVTDQRASQLLRIEWADGAVSELPHSLLRTHCKCAECVAAQRAGAGALHHHRSDVGKPKKPQVFNAH